jgi:hypothetical protein
MPQECRVQACECFRLAEAAATSKARDEFTELRLAAEIESDGRLLEAWCEARMA